MYRNLNETNSILPREPDPRAGYPGLLTIAAVLDDEPHGQRNDPVGVVGLGQGVVGHFGIEVLAAGAAAMLGVGDVNIPRTPGDKIAHVVEDALPRSISIAGLAAPWTGSMLEVATSGDDFRLGQIFRLGDPLRGVRKVRSGTEHGAVLVGQVFPAKKLPKTLGEVMPDSRQ